MSPASRGKKKGSQKQEVIEEKILFENAASVAGRPLPPLPAADGAADDGSLVLFYQYQEPAWNERQHKKALKRFIAIATRHNIKGRGRVAPEGVNCTLSCSTPTGMRAFCNDLRNDWKIGDDSSKETAFSKLFHETDFKITDGIPISKQFKSLSIRKTTELVAYGLDGAAKAPALKEFAGEHLEAVDYHKAMQDKDAVIIDVRNAYESAIGNFQPPKGGAELIDPCMRNSIEWPKWLANPDTQAKLHNKKVLMYCTGGIRCERATALLNEMSAVNPDTLKPKGVYELRGGIERYIKTFPQGGYWTGKNYLFDRRQEQVPAEKPLEQVEQETNAACCVCRNKWTVYRGKFKCSQSLCGVPVIVCDACRDHATAQPQTLTCELCKQGYKAPQDMPDLVGLKRQAEQQVRGGKSSVGKEQDKANRKPAPLDGNRPKKRKLDDAESHANRLFVSRLPLTITKTRLSQWLGDIQCLHWLTDRDSGAFYGSCIVELPNKACADAVLSKDIPKLGGKKKKPKVTLAKVKQGEQWPPVDHKDTEFPPVGR